MIDSALMDQPAYRDARSYPPPPICGPRKSPPVGKQSGNAIFTNQLIIMQNFSAKKLSFLVSFQQTISVHRITME